ncbi:MAG: hypothetical protein US52_C0034G0001 [candidate division WS6 bacterium GW2011_GWA2_37_6]|uniref:Uncharacterized protein n=1 Tax=candidate division WS6 bacterium GW2011_GWA2_37_6 TaxID=1619087 RepID=A0A0G0H9F3_9BACT|nr:MAG: hypothetical protein US52_C0034G0001 [candidate division WS6 bacterium GW2011_GWA2_37_6]
MSTDPQDIHHKKGKFLPLFLLFVALLTSAVFGVLYFLHGGGNVEEVNANSNVETRPVDKYPEHYMLKHRNHQLLLPGNWKNCL